MTPNAHRALRAIRRDFPDREFEATELALATGLNLPEAKGALRTLTTLGAVTKRTDPRRPIQNLYRRQL